MPRTVPAALSAHLKSGATTMCVLVKISPVHPGKDAFGVTNADHDIEYDDGDGSITYLAAVGSEPSALKSSSDMSVDGGETKALLPVYDTPISEDEIVAGVCDYAEFKMYMVNYADLSAGHILYQTGTLGRNVMTDGGLSWTTEFRGLTQPLKQSITEKWSLTCRARFGSQVGDERYPCMFNADTLWTGPHTVTALGTDASQSFTTNGFKPTYGGSPGLVNWLTGRNAGRNDESESFSNGTIGLTFGSMFPVQIGDTFRFRDDCPHTPAACKARGNFHWYRGEPTIPVSDNAALAAGKIGGVITTSE